MARGSALRREAIDLITCNLTKPESTFDQIRRVYKDLKPTDVALLSTALVQSGRNALAEHDGIEYAYPEDHNKLTAALCREIQQIQESAEPVPTKRTAKGVEEEAVTLDIVLKANLKAGDKILGEDEALKTVLSDMVDEGVEFLFSPTDIGWHWSLERVNWATVSGGDLARRFKFRAVFKDNAVGVELGPGGKRKITKSR